MATHPTNIVALIFHAWYYLMGDSQQEAAIKLNPYQGLKRQCTIPATIKLNPYLGIETPKL